MTNTKDLHIAEHILPFFDYTLNHFSKQLLADIFEKPLSSVVEIRQRQSIIQGFIANIPIFENFSYTAVDFHDAHKIMRNEDLHVYRSRDVFRYYYAAAHRNRTIGDLIHVSSFLHELHHKLIQKINKNAFPTDYQQEIIFMDKFLCHFKLDEATRAIRKGKFKLKQVMRLTATIVKARKNGQITRFFETLQHFEVYMSIAMGMDKHRFVFPTMTDKKLAIEQMYHPSLASPVYNDLHIHQNVVLITGANMSGKSTLLKTISLCVFLAHLGVGVPAQQAAIPLFEHFSIMIDHSDDLTNGYSHFMMEIKKLKEVLLHAKKGKACFAIFDELFKGTNMEDALQISTTTIEGLCQFKSSLFFISTHLHQLQDIQAVKEEKVETIYLDCATDTDVPQFTYKIKRGWSDLKIGQILFRLEGLDGLLLYKNI